MVLILRVNVKTFFSEDHLCFVELKYTELLKIGVSVHQLPLKTFFLVLHYFARSGSFQNLSRKGRLRQLLFSPRLKSTTEYKNKSSIIYIRGGQLFWLAGCIVVTEAS